MIKSIVTRPVRYVSKSKPTYSTNSNSTNIVLPTSIDDSSKAEPLNTASTPPLSQTLPNIPLSSIMSNPTSLNNHIISSSRDSTPLFTKDKRKLNFKVRKEPVNKGKITSGKNSSSASPTMSRDDDNTSTSHIHDSTTSTSHVSNQDCDVLNERISCDENEVVLSDSDFITSSTGVSTDTRSTDTTSTITITSSISTDTRSTVTTSADSTSSISTSSISTDNDPNNLSTNDSSINTTHNTDNLTDANTQIDLDFEPTVSVNSHTGNSESVLDLPPPSSTYSTLPPSFSIEKYLSALKIDLTSPLSDIPSHFTPSPSSSNTSLLEELRTVTSVDQSEMLLLHSRIRDTLQSGLMSKLEKSNQKVEVDIVGSSAFHLFLDKYDDLNIQIRCVDPVVKKFAFKKSNVLNELIKIFNKYKCIVFQEVDLRNCQAKMDFDIDRFQHLIHLEEKMTQKFVEEANMTPITDSSTNIEKARYHLLSTKLKELLGNTFSLVPHNPDSRTITLNITYTRSHSLQPRYDYVHEYYRYSPLLRSLCTAVVQWARSRCLLNPEHRLFDSSNLVFMVINYMQIRNFLPLFKSNHGTKHNKFLPKAIHVETPNVVPTLLTSKGDSTDANDGRLYEEFLEEIRGKLYTYTSPNCDTPLITGLGYVKEAFVKAPQIYHYPTDPDLITQYEIVNSNVTLDELVVDFFAYYGYLFHPDLHSVNVRCGHTTFLREQLLGSSDQTFYIENPFNPSQNEAWNMSHFPLAQSEFRRAASLLRSGGSWSECCEPLWKTYVRFHDPHTGHRLHEDEVSSSFKPDASYLDLLLHSMSVQLDIANIENKTAEVKAKKLKVWKDVHELKIKTKREKKKLRLKTKFSEGMDEEIEVSDVEDDVEGDVEGDVDNDVDSEVECKNTEVADNNITTATDANKLTENTTDCVNLENPNTSTNSDNSNLKLDSDENLSILAEKTLSTICWRRFENTHRIKKWTRTPSSSDLHALQKLATYRNPQHAQASVRRYSVASANHAFTNQTVSHCSVEDPVQNRLHFDSTLKIVLTGSTSTSI